jgi:hypothetical protein
MKKALECGDFRASESYRVKAVGRLEETKPRKPAPRTTGNEKTLTACNVSPYM